MERNSKALQADSWHDSSSVRLGASSPFTRSTSRRHCLRSERWLIVALCLATARRSRSTHECLTAIIYNGVRTHDFHAQLN